MSAIPGSIDADRGPPMTIPLRHFLVGTGLLLTGALAGAVQSFDGTLVPGNLGLAHVHLLLVGWVAVTIMGAMTQFVPVWSGVAIHSRRLANAQLWLVVAGLLAFAAALLLGAYRWLPLGGVVMLAGFWTFVYNVGRTLRSARPWDVTERHFAIALGFFVLLTGLGVVLAAGLTRPFLAGTPVSHGSVRMSHATLALYGAVLTTVYGALYQLATMFTQSSLHGIDLPLRRLESVGHPVGVLALAGGRLFDVAPLARVGAVLVVASALGMSVILARRLLEAQVPWTPMLSRYAVLAVAVGGWAVWTGPAWFRDPLDPATLFGAPGAFSLLIHGVIGFVVLGTLYHVVPFIVWVHRYSDRLGLEPVPMIDDLYDDRVARVDFVCFVLGVGLLVVSDAFELSGALGTVSTIGGISVTIGAALFLLNVVLILRRHSPHSVPGLLLGRFSSEGPGSEPSPSQPQSQPEHQSGVDSPPR
ncbi:hypothetical protein ACFQO4_01175 [Saliphagus sp. GCM10025334]